MRGSHSLESLFQYAREYKFNDFNKLLTELEISQPQETLGEAFLLRAQIKLYIADYTILNDLEKISRFSGPIKFPCLFGIWRTDAPNRFIVFPKTPGALPGFLRALPQVRQTLNPWYGQQADIAVRQIQSEIHYFLGEIPEALELAEEQHHCATKNNLDAILTQGLRFRCYLALFKPRQAEQCMLDMIRLSQAHPECLATYNSLRWWANLTTNWNGDSPRFYDDQRGVKMPVLEDRLTVVRMGGGNTTQLEEPFMLFAKHSDENVYAIRQYYMDLFHAMYWFQAGDLQQTELYFLRLNRLALDSGVFMPFVECGEQITPLLRFVKESNWDCSAKWLDMIISRAEQYEAGIEAYQNYEA